MDIDARNRLVRSIVNPIAFVVGKLVVAVLSTMLLFIVVVLRLTKPIVYYPLSIATVGSVGVTIVFAVTDRWHFAYQAALTAVVAGIVLGIYTAAAEWIDPRFFQRSQQPPWWWFV